MEPVENRRPIKSRASRWAGVLSSLLIKSGATPNAISVASVFFAGAAAVCLFYTLDAREGLRVWLLIFAAAGIQLRLVCNLMDGLVAVEGRMGGPCGEIFNDFPDRVADVAILAAAGYATGCGYGILLGWLCACGALMTAYVRVLGTALTGTTDFRGVMAKPQRMAVVTVACIGEIFLRGNVFLWAGLGLILIGTAITCGQRLRVTAGVLQSRAQSE